MTLPENQPASDDPVRALFEQAVACAGEARRSLLDRARLEQPEACEEVEGMLRHVDTDDELLDRNIVDVAGLRGASGGLDQPGLSGRSPELEALDHERTHGTLPIETVIAGFRLERLIGVGGEAAVYEAAPTEGTLAPSGPVALKLIRAELVTAAMIQRFQHEASSRQLAAALDHPGLVRVHAVGVAEFAGAPRPYIAMELIDGRPMFDYARALSLGTRAKLDLVAQVCEALHHAHQRGIQHGRLHPSSILVDERARVLDVGASRLIGGVAGGSSVEAMTNRAARTPDPGVDILAIGEIIYELLVGRRPVAARAEDATPQPPALPSRFDPTLRGEVDAIVLCALAADPARRYATAAELASDIRGYLAKPPGPTPAELTKAHQRRMWRIAAMAAAATIVGALARWLLSSWRQG